jgi:hypothetical protein
MILMPEVEDAVAGAIERRTAKRRSWRGPRRLSLCVGAAALFAGTAYAATEP